MNRIILSTFLVFMGLASVLESSTWEWKTFTSKLEVRGLCGGERLLWCATEGGLLAFDPVLKTFSSWTNTEGLAFNDVMAITCDEEGQIWVGLGDGLIQRFDPIESRWSLVDDFRNRVITCFALSGDTIFVGLDIGVSVYLISRQEVKETYRHLGNEFQVEIPAQDILVAGKEIWVATDEGIARSRLDYTNLMDPENWTNVISEDGIPEGKVTSLAYLENKIYVGTKDKKEDKTIGGLAEWDGKQWMISKTSAICDLTVHENKIYAATDDRVFYKEGDQWLQLGSTLSSVRNLISAFSILWVGSEKGIYFYSIEKGTWEYHVSDCPGSNLISDLTVDLDDNLWCCSRNNGFFRYNGSTWTKYNYSTLKGVRSNDFVTVAVDKKNNKWYGSWGGGAILMTQDSSFKFFHSENGYLAGISGLPDYCVVNDMVADSSGTVWLLNREAVNSKPLVSITPDSVWTYYGSSEGITTIFLRVIAIDLEGRKWVGTDAKGIFVLDDNGTPSNPWDDPDVERWTTSNSALEDDKITAIAADKIGGIWIGTPNGLYYYFGGTIDRRYGLPVDNITALIVDGVNNLWVGTTAGLSLFSDATYNWTHFSVDNSDLANNEVTSLTMDDKSGNLYIGTSRGLSQLETPFAEPRPQLSELSLYPNPFIPKEHTYLTIDNLTFNVAVHIFSVSGFLVRHYSTGEVQGRRLLWDGANDRNEPVAGGIYLIVAHSEEGESRIGKVALVR